MTAHTCPQCSVTLHDDQQYIAHRFNELATMCHRYGEYENAAKYRAKNPGDYQLINGIIERKVP
jgi:hypothetical protein